MSSSENIAFYGNLYSYKLYTRPMARRLFGNKSYRKSESTKHQVNIQKMLKVLALNEPITTWSMAKIQLFDDTAAVRVKEKEYRRMLVGRRDRGKKTPGLLDVGLVVNDGIQYIKGASNLYRLSLHGVLYCLEVLDLSQKEIDMMAQKYAKVLPFVFGRWDLLKSLLGNDVHRLKILASGTFLDNIQVSKVSIFPVYEMLTYLNAKYQDYFETIKENDLADQISCWYYTTLLLPAHLRSKKPSSVNIAKWKKIFDGDSDLKDWYFGFVEEAEKFYRARFTTIKKLKKI